MSKEDTEIIRKLYYYKKLIREGKLNLPIDVAKKFIGPDTAYHLYSKGKFKKKDKSKPKKKIATKAQSTHRDKYNNKKNLK